MSYIIDKCTIITFSIVNNPYLRHPCVFITENCCSKFTIMSFWAPTLNSPAENSIHKKHLDTSLVFCIKLSEWFFSNLVNTLIKSPVPLLNCYDSRYIFKIWLNSRFVNDSEISNLLSVCWRDRLIVPKLPNFLSSH